MFVGELLHFFTFVGMLFLVSKTIVGLIAVCWSALTFASMKCWPEFDQLKRFVFAGLRYLPISGTMPSLYVVLTRMAGVSFQDRGHAEQESHITQSSKLSFGFMRSEGQACKYEDGC